MFSGDVSVHWVMTPLAAVRTRFFESVRVCVGERLMQNSHVFFKIGVNNGAFKKHSPLDPSQTSFPMLYQKKEFGRIARSNSKENKIK